MIFPVNLLKYIAMVKACNTRIGQVEEFYFFDSAFNRAQVVIDYGDDSIRQFALQLVEYAEQFKAMFPGNGTFDDHDCFIQDFRNLIAISHAYFSVEVSDEAKRYIKWFINHQVTFALVNIAGQYKQHYLEGDCQKCST